MSLHLHFNWTPREPEGFQVEIPDLGLVELYLDKGVAVDINGTRAYTFTSSHLDSAKISIQSNIRNWHYLNGFKKDPTS